VGPSPLTSRHQAVDELRGRLHARYDAALAAVGARFSVGVARRPTSGGLTRVVFLHVRPESGRDDSDWPLDTRRWSGALVQHHTLDEVEAEIGAALARYAAGGARPS
jgi:hypothetical protein